jgi:hypothetical protein
VRRTSGSKSRASGAGPAAAWIEGFLEESGTVLIHGQGLLGVDPGGGRPGPGGPRQGQAQARAGLLGVDGAVVEQQAHLVAVSGAVALLEDLSLKATWREALRALADQDPRTTASTGSVSEERTEP